MTRLRRQIPALWTFVVECSNDCGYKPRTENTILDWLDHHPGDCWRATSSSLAHEGTDLASGSRHNAGYGQQKRTAHRRCRSNCRLGHGSGEIRFDRLVHTSVARIRAEGPASRSSLPATEVPSSRREWFCR